MPQTPKHLCLWHQSSSHSSSTGRFPALSCEDATKSQQGEAQGGYSAGIWWIWCCWFPPQPAWRCSPGMSSLMWRSRDRFGLAWQEGLPGIALQSTCCAPEARQSLTLSQPDFCKEPLCLMEVAPKHTPQGIRTNPTGTNGTGERTERLARIRITTSLASCFP